LLNAYGRKVLLKCCGYRSGMSAAASPPEPSQKSDPPSTAGDGGLRADIEAALKPAARLLQLSPELEQRYDDATWRGRSRSLRAWLIVIAFIDVLCIGIDALTMPGHIVEAIVTRGFILSGIYLGAAALLARRRPVWVQGMATLVPTITVIISADYLGNLAGGVHAERYLTAGMFVVFAATIVPNVRFRFIAAQTVLAILTLGVLLFYRSGGSLAQVLAEHVELATFYPASIISALHVRRWIERMHRRNFLLALRDELRLEDLALSNSRREAALGAMSQGIMLREADGLIPLINRRAVELLGLPEEALKGKMHSIDMLRYQAERGEFAAGVPGMSAEDLAAAQSGDVSRIPLNYERQRPDGTIIDVRSHPLPQGGVVRTYTDITERKNNEVALAKARDVAEAASRARSEFLAMMSHEIRTPMNAVLGLTDTLLESDLDDDQRKSGEAIQEASDGLLHILNDILDLSKLDTGKLEFEALPFALESVVDNTKSIVAVRAAEKGLAVRVEIDPNLPKALIGDPGRMRQIVLNLATNAVKFTPSGEVVISAQCVERTATNASVRIAVRDSGIGIAPDRLTRLFSDFVQADASIHRQYGGTGLGLAICKRLVDQMGGAISVESVPGRGSTFSFQVSLPLADIADLEQRNAPDTPLGFGESLALLGRPLRVLIAEDNATNQFVVTRMLREFQIDLQIAHNGVEAVAAAKQGNFDVIFMDMRMPEMDGLEATRLIRAQGGALASLPIIALTANAFADDVRACREAGMNDFVAKPIRKRILVEKLAKVVAVAQAGASSRPAGPAPALAPPEPADQGLLIDRTMLTELCEEISAEGAGEVLQVFVGETRARLAILGKLSVTSDRAAIEIEAHTLKGAAGAIGFARLAALAKTLESQARADALVDYPAQVERIGAAFDDSCREIDAHPVTGVALAS
jgi:signal transduction histidine kinase/DNA-binding NarL/FixJ family response regulator/HPt (histidine-containing phosphotransfer) domain-containing protein